MPNVNVAVIGGGITASLIGYLSRNLTSANLDVWESEDELGGRMKTMKYDQLASRVDIGAQYITNAAAETRNSSEIYSSLLKSGTITHLRRDIVGMKRSPAGIVHYVAPLGMHAVVSHFVNSATFRKVYTKRPVRELNFNDERVQVVDDKGRSEIYDAVVLTPPIPVIFELKGNFKSAIPDRVYDKLQKVEYSCRDCLALFFAETLPFSWAAKYLPQDDVFRYVAIQENKVDASDDGKSSVVFHTSVQFGEKYKSTDDEITKSILIERARRLFPEFPDPVQIRHYKWRHSQVINAYEDSSAECVVISEKPLVVVAGDAFTTSNFDGCIVSAESVVKKLSNFLVKSSFSHS